MPIALSGGLPRAGQPVFGAKTTVEELFPDLHARVKAGVAKELGKPVEEVTEADIEDSTRQTLADPRVQAALSSPAVQESLRNLYAALKRPKTIPPEAPAEESGAARWAKYAAWIATGVQVLRLLAQVLGKSKAAP